LTYVMTTPTLKLDGLRTALTQLISHTQLRSSSTGWIYRGQADAKWPLLPKAGRPEYFIAANATWAARGQTSGDLGRFGVWRENAVAFCEDLPSNDFEALAYAQHYGLATRLLDWTHNPLVALFFAVETKPDAQGVVFCHLPTKIVEADVLTPETCDVVACYLPMPFDRRILMQDAVFTVHPRPNQPLEPGPPFEEAKAFGIQCDLVAILIEADMKAGLQLQLANIGVTRKTLFPDLEGLSEFVNWESRRVAKEGK
jgi:hypothetical protein